MSHTITLTDEQMKALQSGKAITIEPPKLATKWEPKGGNWTVDPSSPILAYKSSITDKMDRTAGIEYDNEKDAIKASKALRIYARQLKWLSENDDGWEADWDNNDHAKFYVYFDIDRKQYDVYSTYPLRDLGTVYMSKENANKLCQLLNAGLVEF